MTLFEAYTAGVSHPASHIAVPMILLPSDCFLWPLYPWQLLGTSSPTRDLLSLQLVMVYEVNDSVVVGGMGDSMDEEVACARVDGVHTYIAVDCLLGYQAADDVDFGHVAEGTGILR